MSVNTYLITIDATDARLERLNPAELLVAYASAAGATFANVHTEATDTHAFGSNDVTLSFDATADDVHTYLAYYDGDDEIITPL